MKMRKEHYQYIKEQLAQLPVEMVEQHLNVTLPEDSRVKDIQMRLRWDCLYAAKLSPWISANLYSYLNDDHIDTALRSIMKELFPTTQGK